MTDVQVGESGLPSSFEEILQKAYEGDPRLNPAPAQEAAEQEGEVPSQAEEDVVETEPTEEVVEAEASEEQPEEEKVDESDEEDVSKYGKRAQKRIRQLNTKNQELEGRLGEVQQYVAQMNAQFQQAYQQSQYQQAQEIQSLKGELQKYQQAFERMQEDRESKDLDPVKKFERDLLKRAEATFEEKLKSERTARETAEKQRLQRETEAREARERQMRFSKWQSELDQVLPKTVLAGLSADKTEELRPIADSFLLAYGAASSQGPGAAAKDFNSFIDALVDERIKIKAKKSGEVVKRNKTLPAASSGVKAAEAQNEEYVPKPPPKDQLMRNGFGTALEWYKAGSPALKIK